MKHALFAIALLAGPAMAQDQAQRDAVQAIRACWNVSALTPEALQVTVIVHVKTDSAGRLNADSPSLVRHSNGSTKDADIAYGTARRAILRAVRGCGDQPALDAALFRQGAYLTFSAEGITLP